MQTDNTLDDNATDPHNSQALDVDAIVKKAVEAQLQLKESQTLQAQNEQKSHEQLMLMFGNDKTKADQALSELKQQLSTFGVSVDDLMKTNPQAFLAHLQSKAPQNKVIGGFSEPGLHVSRPTHEQTPEEKMKADPRYSQYCNTVDIVGMERLHNEYGVDYIPLVPTRQQILAPNGGQSWAAPRNRKG